VPRLVTLRQTFALSRQSHRQTVLDGAASREKFAPGEIRGAAAPPLH
jgi:hypothetical protein